MKLLKHRSLLEGYEFKGFRTLKEIRGRFHDPKALVIVLERRQKKQSAEFVEKFITPGTTQDLNNLAISVMATVQCTLKSKFDVFSASIAKP